MTHHPQPSLNNQVHADQIQMKDDYDEEAPPNELDQQFQEKKFEPATGGWIPLFLLGLLLIVGGVVCFISEIGSLIGLGVMSIVLAFIVLICTCRGITFIDPN